MITSGFVVVFVVDSLLILSKIQNNYLRIEFPEIYLIRIDHKFWLPNQGDQVPGNFKAGPGIICVARKPGIIFQSPTFSNISHIFLFSWVCLRISTTICIKRVHISSEIGFYDAKYQNFRSIFGAARKTIFGKVVTLPISYALSEINNRPLFKLA